MQRQKKLSRISKYDYDELARNSESVIVQKSNPLQSLSETGMSLVEFKILDAYLSRIDSHNLDTRYIRFEKGELEKLLGVSRILKNDLSTRLDGLFRVVTIKDKYKDNGFTKIALFEKAEAIQDENGLWQVDLVCTLSAMEYVFNVENLGYLKYRLKNVIDLTSRYSYILYLYLENNRFRETWSISLSDLKTLLRCTAESYKAYKEFNDKILKKCYKELNEKTNIKYSYESIKKGRSVVAIRFTYLTKKEVCSDETDIDDVDDEQLSITREPERQQALWESALEDLKLSSEQIDEIRAILVTIPDCKLPDAPVQVAIDDIEIRQFHYLQIKVTEINRRDYIKNKYAYLIKLLRQDANLS